MPFSRPSPETFYHCPIGNELVLFMDMFFDLRCLHLAGPSFDAGLLAAGEFCLHSSEDTLWMNTLRFKQERVADYAVYKFIDGPAVFCADGGEFDI